ncbi:MAG TPA: TfoX/Sxy family protein [Micromonosporaceae bacterium]|nr:TfoX/Sxy family protein [Micromonosporaceae bacterium]
MAYDEVLADRVRDRLSDAVGVTERRMFGGVAFLTDGNLTVGVRGEELVVRLSPDEGEEALARPGVRPFDLSGRPMHGWVLVAADHLDDPDLYRWLAEATAYVASLPPR